MCNQYDNYMTNAQTNRPQYVVSVPPPLAISMQGTYFVGQTETLSVSNTCTAWAGLVNPRNSHVNLYANVFTISNFSDESVVAELWLNTDVPENTSISTKVSPSNTSIRPLPTNKVDIRYTDSTTISPENGVNIYKRIVPPMTTLVGEEDGKFIESPCGNYVVIVKPLGSKPAQVVVALGWWEKPRC